LTRASWPGLFEIFVDTAFGTGVVVVVVVVGVVVVGVVVPVSFDAPVAVLVEAVVVAFLPAPRPGAEVLAVVPFSAASVLAPAFAAPAFAWAPVLSVWPPPFGAGELTLAVPPFGALPDLPWAAADVTLTAAIAAAVASRWNLFMVETLPGHPRLQTECRGQGFA
jgi:hypothetical protein